MDSSRLLLFAKIAVAAPARITAAPQAAASSSLGIAGIALLSSARLRNCTGTGRKAQEVGRPTGRLSGVPVAASGAPDLERQRGERGRVDRTDQC